MAEEVFTFEDQDGNKVDFEHIASFDIDNVWYAGFAPVESTDEISDDEVVFFRVEGNEDNQELVAVTDEKELDKVWAEFEKMAHEDCECGCHHDHKECDCDHEHDKCGCHHEHGKGHKHK